MPPPGSHDDATAPGGPPPGENGGGWSDHAQTLRPGTLLGGRYRIVAPLGRGGMGEVYRADDLTLGSPVALKFLPAHVAADPLRLSRLRSEVNLARQVSHPNVCRVFDIAEADGRSFISMEYVDGEDLSTLLRRIGRLPREKAVDLARQLCFGLAALHDAGLLHRDLKPANVMLDGRGRARIMDFGVAAAGELIIGARAMAGTPAYMAPEQLSGAEVSRRSDIYSLGLVLYELFTGKPAMRASSIDELRRLHEASSPTNPSALVDDIDPAAERVILRCLERDPAARPPSAVAVAAALPGGDPVAAALAAGETPSPEMVAASGREGTLRAGVAAGLLAAALALIALVVLLGEVATLHRLFPLPQTPAALETRAREALRALGHDEAPFSSTAVLNYSMALQWLGSAPLAPAERQAALRSGEVSAQVFFFRQSPRSFRIDDWSQRRVYLRQPAQTEPGAATVLLDGRGNLEWLRVVPPRLLPARPDAATPDFARAFALAGLAIDDFEEASPQWMPPHGSDALRAWVLRDGAPGPRIEIATAAGRIVSFEKIRPWTRPPQEATPTVKWADRASTLLVVVGLVAAVWLAVGNVRRGRGDRRGALRLALAFGGAQWLAMFLGPQSLADMLTADILGRELARATWMGLLIWVLYLGLEPLVRRVMPDLMVSWTRLLAGRWRDPLVARHVLIGIGAGALLRAAMLAGAWGAVRSQGPTAALAPELWMVEDPKAVLSSLLDRTTANLAVLFLSLLGLLALRLVLRNLWLAGGAIVAAATGVTIAAGGADAVTIALTLGVVSALTYVAVRLGVLALLATVVSTLSLSMALTADLTVWHAAGSVTALLVPILLAAYGYWFARPHTAP